MPQAITRAERWIFDRLKADGALKALIGTRIYGDEVPAATALPYVQVVYLSDLAMNTRSGYRVWDEMVYLVRAVGGGEVYNSKLALGPIVDRIDALLHQERGAVGTDSAYVHGCLGEGGHSMAEEKDGKRYLYLGGLYRLYVRVPVPA